MEIDVLKAKMGRRGDLVDLPGDVAADHRNAFLRKCDPVPSHVTLIVDQCTSPSREYEWPYSLLNPAMQLSQKQMLSAG